MSRALCFHLDLNVSDILSRGALDHMYQQGLKPVLSFLFSHPKFPLALSIPGTAVEYLANGYPEAIDVLRELVARNQIEIEGGGYYLPILPMQLPVDRSGQIEKLTACVRENFGKRPRGLSLFGSIWDPSLTITFQACGIEYVLLDESLIPGRIQRFCPVICSEQGKNVKILPVCEDLVPAKNESFQEWFSRLQQAFSSDDIANRIVCISVTGEDFSSLISRGFFDSFEIPEFELTLPSLFFKTPRRLQNVYLPAGMKPCISRWTESPYVDNPGKSTYTVYDFFNSYPQNRKLYERMMYVSMLISQCHGGDKMRKKAAQEKLWEAQCAYHFISLPSGLPAVVQKRQMAYRHLSEAEHYIRESKEFIETVTSYDYDNNGLNEYICQMEHFNAVISPVGGQVVSLNIIPSGGNYAAGLSRIKKFDGQDDTYTRGLFSEHLIEKEMRNDFFNCGSGTNLFSNITFCEKKFDAKRKEIQMEGQGVFSSLNLPVLLKKNIIVSSNGFIVQYILKNESPFPLQGIFAIEMNLAETQPRQENSQYSLELVQDGNRVPLDEKKLTLEKGASLLQLADKSGKVVFLFEPNEESGFYTEIIPFSRPVSESEIEVVTKSRTVRFFWNVDLAADRAMEKTISCTIMPSHRKL
ncbi:MAG: DUF1926 domain-containing protein [Treponema sp.]|nr:DUF1926 domain-containing protein [Treponema sp.]